ncbi:MAG: hypothetical protein RL033_514, partial [Pseudomonadota bacterium]
MTMTDPRTHLDRLLAEVRAQRPPPATEPGLPARLRSEFRSRVSSPGAGRLGGTDRAGAGGLSAAGSADIGARWLLAAALLGGGALLLARPSEVSLERPPPLPSPSEPSPSEPAASSQG